MVGAAVGGRGRFSPADRGELNPAGELVLLGRTGRIVKIAGRRLDLAEVENALLALPGVRAACVLAHPQRPDALTAATATDRPGTELRAELAARLAPWKIPARILALPELPVTERGKTEKLKAYDAAFVAQLEEERGLLAVEEYARIVISSERGTTATTLAELGLPEAAVLRIQRVWMNKMGKDPELRRLARSAVEAASES